MREDITRANNPFHSIDRYPSIAQLQQLFNSSLDIICSIDINGKFVHISPSSLEILGYTPEEMIGRCVSDFLLEEDYIKTATAGEEIFSGVNKVNLENRYRKKDGSIAYMTWSCTWDEKELLMFCIGRNDTERKINQDIQLKYEQKIKQQNQEMNDMLERITDGFYALDDEWRIIYANTRCEKILDVKKEDYLSRNIWEAFPGVEQSIIGEQYYQAVRERTEVHFQTFIPMFNGWFEVSAYPSKTGLSVFFRDITERLKIEKEQKRAEEELKKLSLIAKETTDSVSIIELDGTISWVNDAFTKMTGYTYEEAVGKNNSHLLQRIQSNSITETGLEHCINTGKQFKGEILAYTKEGEPRWFQATGQPLYNDAGKAERFFIIQTDITSHKEKQELVRKLSTFIERTKDLIVIVDPESCITWVNGSFENTSGYKKEEVIGTKCSELLQGPGTDPVSAIYIKEQMQNGRSFQAEILNYSKSGEAYWIEIYGQPFFDSKGVLTEYFTIQRNITERKILQQQLAEEETRRQREVTAAVVKTQERERSEVGRELHDNINQILTSVKLYQELILSETGDKQELVKKSMTLLQEVIDENRSLSKRLSAPTLGKIRLHESVQELVDSISTARKFEVYLDACAIKDITVTQDMHLAVYRILQEHLTNIIKYAAAARVQIYFMFMNSNLIMEVIDDGLGFNTNLRHKGIGITNMKIRAEQLQGTFKLESAPGKGCRLTVQLPLVEG